MFKIPHTYNEWMDCLDAFKDETSENEVLDAMMFGTVEWQSGVAERFTQAIFNVIQYKLDNMQKNFNLRISKPVKSNIELENNFLYVRRTFKKLLNLSQINAFPKELSESIEKYIIDTADAFQNSLLDSAKKDRSGVIKSLVKKNAVNKLRDTDTIDKLNPVNETCERKVTKNAIPTGAKRRIIF